MESKSAVLKRINDGFPAYWERMSQQRRYRPLAPEDIPELLALSVENATAPPDELPGSVRAELSATFLSRSGEVMVLPGRLWSLGYDRFGVRLTSEDQTDQLTVPEEILEALFFAYPGVSALTWNDRPD